MTVYKTKDYTWRHKGWDISRFGDGYRMVRRENVNGKTIALTAGSLKRAEVIIENKELEIKTLGRIVDSRK